MMRFLIPVLITAALACVLAGYGYVYWRNRRDDEEKGEQERESDQ